MVSLSKCPLLNWNEVTRSPRSPRTVPFPLPVPLSLVSRTWPCVAYSCWILSSRGTKRPDVFLKDGKKAASESTHCSTAETDTGSIAPTPAGAPRRRELETGRPQNGGGTSVSLVGLRGGLATGRDWAVGLGGPLLGQKAKNGRQMAKQEVPAWRGIGARWPCLCSASAPSSFSPSDRSIPSLVLPSCCCSVGPAIPVNLLHCLPPQAPAVPAPAHSGSVSHFCPLLT